MNKTKKLIIAGLITCISASLFANTKEDAITRETLAQKHAMQALSLFYIATPQKSWHTFFCTKAGIFPESVAETLNIDPSSIDSQELERIAISAFAAYFKVYGEHGKLEAIEHLEEIVENDDSLSELEKKTLPYDIFSAVYELVVSPFSSFVSIELQDTLREMPWFLDGIPEPLDSDAAALALYEHLETSTEKVSCDGDICNEETRLKDEQPKKTLRQHWNEKVRPHLKQGIKEIEELTKTMVGEEKGQKIIDETKKIATKVEQEVKPVIKEVEKALKKFKKKW